MEVKTPAPLRELAILFLKLGATSFGGPAAHISLMEDEFVQRRQWLSRPEFMNLIAMTNLIPGPNSTELAIHIGYQRAGWRGLWVAGICFILPAFLIVSIIAAFYVQFSSLPLMNSFMIGAKAMVLGLILQALGRFSLSLFKAPDYRSLLSQAVGKSIENRIYVLLVLLTALLHFNGTASEIPLLLIGSLTSWFLLQQKSFKLWNLGPLFWIFFKIGSVLFGSGYVLLSFLKTEFIDRRGWISHAQLMDAITVGQFTPGPVFTTASFLGYIMQGPSGALIATIGIFLPAFLFVMLSIPLYRKIQNSPSLNQFLQGVVAVSLGLLLSTTMQIGKETLHQPLSWGIFLGGLVLLRFRVPSALLIPVAGVISALVL